MISIEGYEPLNVFYFAAKKAFDQPISEEISRRNAKAREDGDERPIFPWSVANATHAAEFTVWELVAKKWSETTQRPHLLKADGATVSALPDILCPLRYVTGPLRKQMEKIHLDRDKSIPFYGMLEAISQTYWIGSMVDEPCFQSRARPISKYPIGLPIVDWVSGTLDLSILKRFYAGMESLRKGAFDLQSIGADIRLGKRIESVANNLGSKETVYRPLLPYDGSVIILPSAWLKELESKDEVRATIGSLSQGDSLEETILNLWNGGFTKAEIKTVVCRDYCLSKRKFDKHWADTASKNSALSAPGRRAKKS